MRAKKNEKETRKGNCKRKEGAVVIKEGATDEDEERDKDDKAKCQTKIGRGFHSRPRPPMKMESVPVMVNYHQWDAGVIGANDWELPKPAQEECTARRRDGKNSIGRRYR